MYEVKTDTTYLEGYIDLYNTGISVKDDESFDFIFDILHNKDCKDHVTSLKDRKTIIETFNVLTLSNTRINIIDRDKSYNELMILESAYQTKQNKTLKIKHFINQNKYFYMIPLQDVSGNIASFIFRAVLGVSKGQNKYADGDKVTKLPLMYGFYEDFLDYDSHKTPQPIVVCEGLKDCIYLKQFYPYVLSNNTSKLGSSTTILRNLTNKIVLVYDNDSTGDLSIKNDAKILTELGFFVRVLDFKSLLQTEHKFKDVAELINYPEHKDRFETRFLTLLKEFSKY